MSSNRSYSDKLRDPRWQKKRLEILNRDSFTCRHCGDSTKELQVHHVNYVSGNAPWDYEQSALITLCSVCHDRIETTNRSVREWLAFDPMVGELINGLVALLKKTDGVPRAAAGVRLYAERPQRISPIRTATKVEPTPTMPVDPVTMFLEYIARVRPPMAARLARQASVEIQNGEIHIFASAGDVDFRDALRRHSASLDWAARETLGEAASWRLVSREKVAG